MATKSKHEAVPRGMRIKITRAMLWGLTAEAAGERYELSKSGAFFIFQLTVDSFFFEEEMPEDKSLAGYRKAWKDINGHCLNLW